MSLLHLFFLIAFFFITAPASLMNIQRLRREKNYGGLAGRRLLRIIGWLGPREAHRITERSVTATAAYGHVPWFTADSRSLIVLRVSDNWYTPSADIFRLGDQIVSLDCRIFGPLEWLSIYIRETSSWREGLVGIRWKLVMLNTL